MSDQADVGWVRCEDLAFAIILQYEQMSLLVGCPHD